MSHRFFLFLFFLFPCFFISSTHVSADSHNNRRLQRLIKRVENQIHRYERRISQVNKYIESSSSPRIVALRKKRLRRLEKRLQRLKKRYSRLSKNIPQSLLPSTPLPPSEKQPPFSSPPPESPDISISPLPQQSPISAPAPTAPTPESTKEECRVRWSMNIVNPLDAPLRVRGVARGLNSASEWEPIGSDQISAEKGFTGNIVLEILIPSTSLSRYQEAHWLLTMDKGGSLSEVKSPLDLSSCDVEMEQPPAIVLDEKIILPVEVMSGDGAEHIESRQFTLPSKNSATSLYVQCHRCTFRDIAQNPNNAKASVRIDDAPWTDILPSNVTLYPLEARYGGFGSSFYTVRFTIPLNKPLEGSAHTIDFRFNKTDGLTSGFRILDFNVLDSNGAKLIALSSFFEDSPSSWPQNFESNTISEGRELWSATGTLKTSAIDESPIEASCSDCHDSRGRDLKYFNYSNKSIAERSVFHGLTKEQGLKIAAYIRSLPNYSASKGRPWNPPYQPGPGIDSRGSNEWSAGAGLEAVLEDDAQTLDFLFPQGTTQDAIDRVTNLKGTLNVREIPVAIQMPDWNAWLPDIHPKDIWPERFERIIRAAFEKAETKLETEFESLVSKQSIGTVLDVMEREARADHVYDGSQPCKRYYQGEVDEQVRRGTDEAVQRGFDCADVRKNFHQWLSVKVWELTRRFNLEKYAKVNYTYGETHGWLGKFRSVFEIAAHRSSNNSFNYEWQTKPVAATSNAAWYHLQLVLTAGGYREPNHFHPQDWFYTPNWIAHLALENNDAGVAGLLAVTKIKQYQSRDTTGPDGRGVDKKMEGNGYWMPFMHPWRLESVQSSIHTEGKPYNQLDTYEEGLRVKFTNSMLKVFLDKVEPYTADEIEVSDRNVSPIAYNDGDQLYIPPGDDTTQTRVNAFYRALVRFKRMGVPQDTLERLARWAQKVWPSGNWSEAIS